MSEWERLLQSLWDNVLSVWAGDQQVKNKKDQLLVARSFVLLVLTGRKRFGDWDAKFLSILNMHTKTKSFVAAQPRITETFPGEFRMFTSSKKYPETMAFLQEVLNDMANFFLLRGLPAALQAEKARQTKRTWKTVWQKAFMDLVNQTNQIELPSSLPLVVYPSDGTSDFEGSDELWKYIDFYSTAISQWQKDRDDKKFINTMKKNQLLENALVEAAFVAAVKGIQDVPEYIKYNAERERFITFCRCTDEFYARYTLLARYYGKQGEPGKRLGDTYNHAKLLPLLGFAFPTPSVAVEEDRLKSIWKQETGSEDGFQSFLAYDVEFRFAPVQHAPVYLRYKNFKEAMAKFAGGDSGALFRRIRSMYATELEVIVLLDEDDVNQLENAGDDVGIVLRRIAQLKDDFEFYIQLATFARMFNISPQKINRSLQGYGRELGLGIPERIEKNRKVIHYFAYVYTVHSIRCPFVYIDGATVSDYSEYGTNIHFPKSLADQRTSAFQFKAYDQANNASRTQVFLRRPFYPRKVTIEGDVSSAQMANESETKSSNFKKQMNLWNDLVDKISFFSELLSLLSKEWIKAPVKNDQDVSIARDLWSMAYYMHQHLLRQFVESNKKIDELLNEASVDIQFKCDLKDVSVPAKTNRSAKIPGSASEFYFYTSEEFKKYGFFVQDWYPYAKSWQEIVDFVKETPDPLSREFKVAAQRAIDLTNKSETSTGSPPPPPPPPPDPNVKYASTVKNTTPKPTEPETITLTPEVLAALKEAGVNLDTLKGGTQNNMEVPVKKTFDGPYGARELAVSESFEYFKNKLLGNAETEFDAFLPTDGNITSSLEWTSPYKIPVDDKDFTGIDLYNVPDLEVKKFEPVDFRVSSKRGSFEPIDNGALFENLDAVTSPFRPSTLLSFTSIDELAASINKSIEAASKENAEKEERRLTRAAEKIKGKTTEPVEDPKLRRSKDNAPAYTLTSEERAEREAKKLAEEAASAARSEEINQKLALTTQFLTSLNLHKQDYLPDPLPDIPDEVVQFLKKFPRPKNNDIPREFMKLITTTQKDRRITDRVLELYNVVVPMNYDVTAIVKDLKRLPPKALNSVLAQIGTSTNAGGNFDVTKITEADRNRLFDASDVLVLPTGEIMTDPSKATNVQKTNIARQLDVVVLETDKILIDPSTASDAQKKQAVDFLGGIVPDQNTVVVDLNTASIQVREDAVKKIVSPTTVVFDPAQMNRKQKRALYKSLGVVQAPTPDTIAIDPTTATQSEIRDVMTELNKKLSAPFVSQNAVISRQPVPFYFTPKKEQSSKVLESTIVNEPYYALPRANKIGDRLYRTPAEIQIDVAFVMGYLRFLLVDNESDQKGMANQLLKTTGLTILDDFYRSWWATRSSYKLPNGYFFQLLVDLSFF